MKSADQKMLAQNAGILLVDDDSAILDSLSEYLRLDDWRVECAKSGEEALVKLKEGQIDFVITDISMPGMDGLDLLRRIKQQRPEVEIIIMTGIGTEEIAIQALKAGASDYFNKPIRGPEVEASLLRSGRVKELSYRNSTLKALVSRLSLQAGEYPMIGVSEPHLALLAQLKKIADSPDATVLLTGESGVGKEVAARMLHQLSRPDDAPFIALNCGGVAESLLERELFGHERGAFTGAEKRSPGVFEMAMEGTILLDEISELHYTGQSRLNRVLEERTFRRVGGSTELHLKRTRIIAATNKNLEALVAEGAFREDLYFRLRVVPVLLPTLRERREDILPLAEFFLQKRGGDRVKTLSPEAAERLMAYSYPGNVRELRNVIENAAIFSSGPVIKVADLTFSELATNGAFSPRERGLVEGQPESLDLETNEIALINKALLRAGNNHTKAARELGLTPQALYRRLDKYGLA